MLQWRVYLLLSILLSLPINLLHAQPLTVIRAARMLDVNTGKSIQNVHIVIEKDRIKSVNDSALPENARIMVTTQAKSKWSRRK